MLFDNKYKNENLKLSKELEATKLKCNKLEEENKKLNDEFNKIKEINILLHLKLDNISDIINDYHQLDEKDDERHTITYQI